VKYFLFYTTLVTSLCGCVGDSRVDGTSSRREPSTFVMADNERNRQMGNVKRVFLEWRPSSGEAGKIVWDIVAIRPVPYRGFKFKVFETPEGFRTITNDVSLPQSGAYVFFIAGENYKGAPLLQVDLKPSTILSWRRLVR